MSIKVPNMYETLIHVSYDSTNNIHVTVSSSIGLMHWPHFKPVTSS